MLCAHNTHYRLFVLNTYNFLPKGIFLLIIQILLTTQQQKTIRHAYHTYVITIMRTSLACLTLFLAAAVVPPATVVAASDLDDHASSSVRRTTGHHRGAAAGGTQHGDQRRSLMAVRTPTAPRPTVPPTPKATKAPKKAPKKKKNSPCKKSARNSFTLDWAVELLNYEGSFMFTLQQGGTTISSGSTVGGDSFRTVNGESICLPNGSYSLVWETCADRADLPDNIL